MSIPEIDNIPSNIAAPFWETPYGHKLSIYDIFLSFDKKKKKELTRRLIKKGYKIKNFETFQYKGSEAIKHLFIHFEKEKEAVPYFSLPEDVYQAICMEAIKVFAFQQK